MSTLDLKRFETIRTTVTLPADLAERSQHFVDEGLVPSRNALIVAAVERFLEDLEQVEIDRQFAAMAGDQVYRMLNEEMVETFADSDWEALALSGANDQ